MISKVIGNLIRFLLLRKFTNLFQHLEMDANGNEVSFEKFRGKVVYGVNVASRCGYTASGYALLSKLSNLKDKGVKVALFPFNQFIF